MFTENEKELVLDGLDMVWGLVESSGKAKLTREEFDELYMRIENEAVPCPWCESEMMLVDVDEDEDYEVQEWACTSCPGYIQVIAAPPQEPEESPEESKEEEIEGETDNE